MPESMNDAPASDAPTPDEIRAATDRMIASEVFSRSPQLGAFLRFVVDAVLNGKADRIKAYTIGVEVLRRDEKFDPQLDPIVRVEATRLRRAIERYYGGVGAGDPLIIDLPRGSYVPTFRRREIEKEAAAPLADTAPMRGMARLVGALTRSADWFYSRPYAAAFTAVAMLAVAGVGLGLSMRNAGSGMAPPARMSRDFDGSGVTSLPRGNGLPTIVIEPLRVFGSPDPAGISAERLHAKIRDAFARFDVINVAVAPTSGNGSAEPPAERPEDYRLSGAVEYSGGTATAWFSLTSVAEGRVVWSRSFDHLATANASAGSEDAIVIGLSNSLLQSYGVIRARDRANQLASDSGDPRYRCLLEAADAMRTNERASYAAARDCLEHLTALDPSFAVGLTFLGLIYNAEFQLNLPPAKPGEAPQLERALRAVRQAIAQHPESSRGYLALMVVQFNRRDIPASLAAGEKSVTLNKYDMLALGEYGGRLILSGDVANGRKKMLDAGAHGAVRPAWHHAYLFIGAYMAGDMAQAVRHAHEIPSDNSPLGQVARALAAHLEGNPDAARKALDRLATLNPGWRRDPRAELARVIPDEGIVDRLSRDLTAAGDVRSQLMPPVAPR